MNAEDRVAQFIGQLAITNAKLAEENERLKEDNERLRQMLEPQEQRKV